MAGIQFRVLGVTETLARFSGMAAAGELAAEYGTADLASEIATLAQQLCPVDTGFLRDSITAEPGGVFVYADYAAYVEYGTVNAPAQPYLRPAIDTVNEDAALARAIEVLRAA